FAPLVSRQNGLPAFASVKKKESQLGLFLFHRGERGQAVLTAYKRSKGKIRKVYAEILKERSDY
ncbi:MAG: hypothetical protein Q8P36_01510, partial [bacterium]|nr:hypothetical protein [bacterium]